MSTVPATRMTVAELLALISGLGNSRPAPVPPPLLAGVVLAGIEVISTPWDGEPTLRRIWRDRQGGGAVPLLLLADNPERGGSVYALGPLDSAGPLRSVDSVALSQVLRRIASLSRLDAVRELAAELDRLDQAGIPGLKLRQLLTTHTLDSRFRGNPARWTAAQESVARIVKGGDWRTVLIGLGYELERRQHRGYLARFEGRPIAVVHPKADPSEFSRLGEDGRPAEGVLLNDCQQDGAPFGMLVSGSRMRLFEVEPALGSSSTRYLDVDANILEEGDRGFLALLGPRFLADGEFVALEAEARAFGVALRERIDETIRQTVLPTLGKALGRWAKSDAQDLGQEAVREELERAALTLVFRALFLLFAESSGYLPMHNRAYSQASVSGLVNEAAQTRDHLGAKSTSLWDRFVLLVRSMRTGNPAWSVPAYNGALFGPHGFDGAGTLERLTLTDPEFAGFLVGIGQDPESGAGIDYSTLEIANLGHVYEGLLSLRLSLAASPLRYNSQEDRYELVGAGEKPDVHAGDLLWLTNEGGRKGGGVYYTRSELVRHLVREAVIPGFETHLERVRETAATDPSSAAKQLFDFAVLDPACGSAHFLVVVVNELADLVVRFLGATPLPDVGAALERLRAGATPGAVLEDVALLRRLVLKHCVFGVDVSPMGAEVAKISLWLASFVPGLSLAYLGRNVIVGNSLVGVARAESLLVSNGATQISWLEQVLEQALRSAAQASAHVAEIDDRNPEEVEASEAGDVQVHKITANLSDLFNVWTAEPLGIAKGRAEVLLHGPSILQGKPNAKVDEAEGKASRHRFLHWPVAFPGIFTRPSPGFDAVVGNPPWDEVMVEELGFYGLFQPGLRSLPEQARLKALQRLTSTRPELVERLAEEQAAAEELRRYFQNAEYASMPGHPDVYKFFCQRYRTLLREGGRLGVVLPRTAFATEGSEGFRDWLFTQMVCKRIDFILNAARWAFDSEPRYTVSLVAAVRDEPPQDHRVQVAGTASSLAEWERQIASPGLALPREAFGLGWTVPLIRNQLEADLLVKMRKSRSFFPFGSSGRWQCFAVQELNETFDRSFWQNASEGMPLWKGESFDQYNPHGAEARRCPLTKAVQKKLDKPRPGLGSLLADKTTIDGRREAVRREVPRARIAFRDVSRATDSRTVRACLVPPGTLLTNKAPYLAFVIGGDRERAGCLAIMNSLPFDWQARRYVEVSLNFFILEGLTVPDLPEEDFLRVSDLAAQLSCVDDRYADFAKSFGMKPGPLDEDQRDQARAEIDARVCRAWNLTHKDLDVLLADFSLDAVPLEYRKLLSDELSRLT